MTTKPITAEQMKHYDSYTINTIGIPSLVLMERAALANWTTLSLLPAVATTVVMAWRSPGCFTLQVLAFQLLMSATLITPR